MTIGQLAKAANIKPSAIRYYEAAGLMPKPTRKHGVRQYDAETIDQLKILRFFRSSGIPVKSLAAMADHKLDSVSRRSIVLEVLERQIAGIDSWIDEAQQTKALLEKAIECRCDGVTAKCPIFTPL